MSKLFTRSHNWMDLRDILEKRQPFANSTKSFRGEQCHASQSFALTRASHVGQMDESERLIMLADAENYGIDYVVYSFATPVAWVRSDGYWRVTDRSYSVTTAKHLSKLRTAVSALESRRVA